MGALQRIIGQIHARLRDITVSQRIALLLGGALVAMSLVWLVQWAASPEMVPLLDQDLAPEELALVQSGLEALGEDVEVRGNRVYVRAGANRQALYAQLQQQEKLPVDTSVGFSALIQESDPWISMEESDRRWTYTLQEALEGVLEEFNGVKSASVFLNLGTQKKSFTRNPPPSSASVSLTLEHGGEVQQPLAMAAARFVAGAVAGLPVHAVEVVDAATGRVALDWDADRDITNKLDRKLAREELRYAQKIRQILADEKALVSVQVELNMTASATETDQPLKGVPSKERTTEQETMRGRRSEQPGVQPNVGLAAGSGATEERQTERTNEVDTEVGRQRKSETTPPGDITKVTAAISLSQSYLAAVFGRANPGAAEPGDVQIEEVFLRERTRLLSQVMQLVRPQHEENVAISWYYDAPRDALPMGPTGAVDQTLDWVHRYGPQSGLALLAIVSLGLMLRMARKSDSGEAFGLELGLPAEAIEAAKRAAQDVSALAGRMGGSAAGGKRGAGDAGGGPEAELASTVEQASIGEGMLVAQEVEPGTVQVRKMLEQVSEMVDTDPETVSTLVDQWIQRSDQYHDEVT